MKQERPRRRMALQRSRPVAYARRAEPTVSTTMRLRSSVRHGLKVWAERVHRSVSEIAQELIEEGLRMRECPGIYFASEPAGRTAKIAGTGLGVWEVLRDFVLNKDVKRLQRAFPQLSHSQLTAALMYYTRYPDEVAREVGANATLTSKVLERRYPGLVRVVRAG